MLAGHSDNDADNGELGTSLPRMPLCQSPSLLSAPQFPHQLNEVVSQLPTSNQHGQIFSLGAWAVPEFF